MWGSSDKNRGAQKMRGKILNLFVLVLVLSFSLMTALPAAPVLAQNNYTLTVVHDAHGSVTAPGVGDFTYAAGTAVYLVAKPAAGYDFVNWVGNVGTVANVNANPTTITMNGNYSIAASFAIRTYSIIATAGDNGSISPSGATTVDYGGSQTFTITPNTGYHISDVLVDGSSVGAVTSYTFTNFTTGHTIAARFAIGWPFYAVWGIVVILASLLSFWLVSRTTAYH